ncbi:alpha/beta hydrolase domain-containing protein [Thioalkalivibrio sp. HK1]|uniref:alpha/beta hydrolase domain-containing protein n=1 Tax=Thioalkalivibrio sp. HK1 TaxID=1469245 RepID=UPI00047175F2|nr:alpha/beta hydrolase domain-containing protein [Thioalkalivibrio sp. HK1]
MPDIVRLKIDEREDFADGHRFGESGPFERLEGRAHFSVDPDDPAWADIVDLDKVARNEEGLVEYASDFCILKPKEGAGNRRLLFAYGNRGNKRELQFFNDAPASNRPRSLADAGNGFLMRRGYTVVWAAWEGDLLPGDGRLCLDLPVAYHPDGSRITGLIRREFIADRLGVSTFPLSGQASTRSDPTLSLDTTRAVLTKRRYPDSTRTKIAADRFAFARIEYSASALDAQGTESALVESDCHLHLFDGFEAGQIYELTYTACDPRPYGAGHAVVRDLVNFLRCEGDPARNPLAGSIDRAYAWGRSQTGRCIRDFVHKGYNAAPSKGRIFDAVMPHVSGAGLMWMNQRFSRVVSPAGQQYEDHDNCADRFPFAYGPSTDHLSGLDDAILKRPDTDPLVIHTQSASEYWQRRGSLVHTDTEGKDLEPPENVRIYLWSSSQHFANPNITELPSPGICRQPENIVQTSMFLRAMLDALDAWVVEGRPPPASRIPRRADGTLVDFDEWAAQFPHIPGVVKPKSPNLLPRLDFGPDFSKGLLREPPRWISDGAKGDDYAILVPAVDADGNDVAGVRAPMVAAPLCTYTGWNLRRKGFGHGAMHVLSGSTIPFPDSDEEAQWTGDPRPSIQSRYGSIEDYLRAIEAAARRLVEERLMLEEDIERAVERAKTLGEAFFDALP